VGDELSEEKIESSIRDYVGALERNDVERAASFFADDAVWHAPEGEFKGKDEIKRYISWSLQGSPNSKFEDTGIGIVVKENKAAYEFIWEGTHEGTPIREPGICLYKFSGGKCIYHRSILDRLSTAEQSTTGFLGKRIIGTIVEQAEKGLH